MTLPVHDQVRYWSIATAVFVVMLWLLGDVLLPFVLGGAIAYFLDPVADRLEGMDTSRVMATAIITLAAILVFAILMLLVVPIICVLYLVVVTCMRKKKANQDTLDCIEHAAKITVKMPMDAAFSTEDSKPSTTSKDLPD